VPCAPACAVHQPLRKAAGRIALTVTTSGLTRAAAVAAVAGGTIFVAVQIGHPQLTTTSITSANVKVREYLKVVFAALAVAGITGMYLNQVRRNGTVGLIGYLLLAVGYLSIMCTTFMGAFVAPTIVGTNPGYVKDVIALATGRGSVTGDLGALDAFWKLQAVCYLAGGLIFGIALFRAGVLARWACVFLAVSGAISAVLSKMPDAFYRLLAVPNGIALIGLGVSLWQVQRQVDAGARPAAEPPAEPVAV
jgi:hypothetical protein